MPPLVDRRPAARPTRDSVPVLAVPVLVFPVLAVLALAVPLAGAAQEPAPVHGVGDGVGASDASGAAGGTSGASGASSAKDRCQGPWFEDRAQSAGVGRPHHNRSFANPYARIMEGYTSLGASGAVGDYDRDGFEDLFVTDSSVDGSNRLYRNDGDFTFTDVTAASGLSGGNDAANASAASLWLDYDNDGWQDLFVVRFGQSLLFRNRGDGTFQDVTESAGLIRHLNSIVVLAFDYDADGDLDLFLGNYFQPVNLFDPETPRFFPESFETATNGGGITLYRNEGDGTFRDVTAAAGLDHHTGWTLDLGHADADLDGDQDLYVAVDFGTDRFFANRGDGTFADATESAIGIDTKKGMNADWGDFDNDGLFDVYVTNITDEYMKEGNFLWHNDGDLTFSDLARETGTYDTDWGWAGKFFDYDNDGWLDLYVVNGWVSAGPDNYVLDIFEMLLTPDIDMADARNWPPMGDKSLSGYQPNRLFHNRGGTLFEEVGACHEVGSKLDGRGIAVADFDRDGREDLFVANANAAPHLYRNTAPAVHWASFALVGGPSNRDAVGARLELTVDGMKRVGFVNGGNGFASQSSRRVHFGLGKASVIERLEVIWPSGKRQVFQKIEADRIYRIVEGRAELVPFVPAAPKATDAHQVDDTPKTDTKMETKETP